MIVCLNWFGDILIALGHAAERTSFPRSQVKRLGQNLRNDAIFRSINVSKLNMVTGGQTILVVLLY